MEAQILKTESKVSSMQTQIANLVQQYVVHVCVCVWGGGLSRPLLSLSLSLSLSLPIFSSVRLDLFLLHLCGWLTNDFGTPPGGSRNAADKKEMSAYKAEIAGLKATLALKLDKPSKLPFAKPLFSACSKDETACAPSVEANEVGTLEMNSCCGSVVINSKECTVSPCELLNDLNVVKELLGI